VQQQIYQHTFANGLTLLAERMEHVRSAVMYLMVPAGCAHDPPEQLGLAGVLSEMITRGAGPRDSRELTMALDNLGLDHSESVGLMHMAFGGGTIACNLPKGLEIFADILRRPHLPEDELESCQELALQNIASLEDEPGSRVMVELDKHFYPTPISNDQRGTVEGIEALDIDSIRRYHQKFFRPGGSILSVAGNIQWEPLLEQVQRLFGDWQGAAPTALTLGPEPEKHVHIDKELEQTQIALAYPSIPVAHEDFYAAMGAANILSGGMGSRLFTEIREKEGLCYSVDASFQPLKDRGAMVASAASLNHQAQRTLDKLLEELRRLPQGIEEEEIQRVRVRLKTSLIMQQESPSKRATAMASNWYYLGRVRRFEEVEAAVNGLSVKSILDHLHRYPPKDFSIVTLGPSPLTHS